MLQRLSSSLVTHGVEIMRDTINGIIARIRNMSSSSDNITQFKGEVRAGKADGWNQGGFRIGGGEPKYGDEGLVVANDGYDGWGVIRPSRWVSSAEMALMPTPRAGLCQTTSGSSTVTVLSGAMPSSEDIGKPIWIYNQVFDIVSFDTESKTIQLSDAPTVTGQRTFTICYNWGMGQCSIGANGLMTIQHGDCVNFTPGIKVRLEELGTWHDLTFIDTRHATLNPAPPVGTYTYYWWNNVDHLASAFRIHRIADAGFEENLSIVASCRGYYEIHAMAKDGNHEQLPIFIGSGWESHAVPRHTITADQNGDALLGGHYESAPLRIKYNNRDVKANRLALLAGTGTTPEFAAEGVDANISIRLRPKGSGVNVMEGGLNVQGVSYLNGRVEHTNELHPSTDGTIHCGRASNRYNTFWATNGVISTSDGRLKDIEDITDKEISIGLRLAKGMIKYKWKDRSDDKYHFGIIAQEIMVAFEEEGLNAFDYGVLHYDKEADLMSVNYGELQSLCIMALASK